MVSLDRLAFLSTKAFCIHTAVTSRLKKGLEADRKGCNSNTLRLPSKAPFTQSPEATNIGAIMAVIDANDVAGDASVGTYGHATISGSNGKSEICANDSIVDSPSAMDTTHTKEETASPSLDETAELTPSTSVGPIHFLFIVHGHRGRPTDLSYLHHAVKDKAAKGTSMNASSSGSCVVGAIANNNSDSSSPVVENGVHSKHWSVSKAIPKKLRRKKRDRAGNGGGVRQHSNQNGIGQKAMEDDRSGRKKASHQHESTFIVHNAACNEGRTHDGIEKGGDRLANEILDVIRNEVKRKRQQFEQSQGKEDQIDVTISIVGNSLGGLYGRYAVARLAEILGPAHDSDSFDKSTSDINPSNDNATDKYGKEAEVYYVMDENVHVHFNVFCSTASPHLGCASHTYVPIPRAAEIGVAYTLGDTGRDLFRLNDLIHTMATSPRFLRPLSSFRKRIAYANAFGTDFPVPGTTAAFLSSSSDSPHYFDEYFDEEGGAIIEEMEKVGSASSEESDASMSSRESEIGCPATEKGLFVATLHTPRVPLEQVGQGNVVDLAASLDSLGWKKVFVDIRGEIPLGVPLPTIPSPFSFKPNSEQNTSCPVRKLKSNRVVESRHLASAISVSGSDRINLPLGHNVICAFERGSVSGVMNSGGRPVMDSLAIELTQEISCWSQ